MSEVQYLESLLMLMVDYDQHRQEPICTTNINCVRMLPPISAKHRSAAAREMTSLHIAKLEAVARPKDDALLVQLDNEYVGAIMLDSDGRSMVCLDGRRRKRKLTYKVTHIASMDSWYEAVCIPVELDDKGTWIIPDEFLVVNDAGDKIKGAHYKKYELGVKVACLEDPVNPKRVPYLDEYIKAHVDRVASGASSVEHTHQTQRLQQSASTRNKRRLQL